MGDQLLIRGVPENIRTWIERESHQRMMAKKEFVIRTLEMAYNSGSDPGLFDEAAARPMPVPDSTPFTFSDLFAGIGGLRIALQRCGGQCVFTSEWDKHAQRTYTRWFGETPHGDITKIKPKDIPDHDVLAAGFPCQPFSIAGVSKKNSLGKAHGFKCLTQGTLFFNIISIVEIKRPPVLLLENVKNLKSHDKGRTWEVIAKSLHEQKYWVFEQVLDASDFGVPQRRERVFIVCFDKHVFAEKPPFEFPKPQVAKKAKLADVLEDSVDGRYTLTAHLWNYLQEYAKRHREKGNGFGYGLAKLDGTTRTLSARYYKDGSEILVPQKRKPPRRLTPRECARLMGYNLEVAKSLGFDEELPIVVTDTQAYRQFGNSVVPAVAEAVAKQVVKVLSWQFVQSGKCLIKTHSNGYKK